MITLQLTAEQINTVLNALAQQPYIQVHELIHSIQEQAMPQVEQAVIEQHNNV